MSSISDTDNIAQALDCGADDLILKPVSRQQLHARLRTVARLHKTQLDLVKLAEIDALTGVLNRRAFFHEAYTFFDAPMDEPLSAIMLDIDHFKRVNDNNGHEAGDNVLKRIAGLARARDLIMGRLGGEEFAILLPGRDADDTFEVAEDMRQEFSELAFEGGNGPFNVTCSFGISARSRGDTPDSLLRRADTALYEAKENGRNQVCIRERDESDIIADARTRPAPRTY
jgi:diguanylate cyclase (GGDEF)-like protein